MGQRYSQLGTGERFEIARLLSIGTSIRQIAATLDRSASSISREIERNGGRSGYLAEFADQQARARRWQGSRLDRDEDLRNLVLDHLRRGWSPEQIVGRLRMKSSPSIGVESIYRFIHARSAGTRTIAGAITCRAARPSVAFVPGLGAVQRV